MSQRLTRPPCQWSTAFSHLARLLVGPARGSRKTWGTHQLVVAPVGEP